MFFVTIENALPFFSIADLEVNPVCTYFAFLRVLLESNREIFLHRVYASSIKGFKEYRGLYFHVKKAHGSGDIK